MEALEETGAAVCRVPCGSARTRDASWTVLLLLLSSYPILCLSVCLVLSLRVSNPWEPERLFASVPCAVGACFLLPRGSVVRYQNTECTTRERICTASNSLEVGRLVRTNTPLKKVHPASSRALCMVAWLRGRLCCSCSGLICQ